MNVNKIAPILAPRGRDTSYSGLYGMRLRPGTSFQGPLRRPVPEFNGPPCRIKMFYFTLLYFTQVYERVGRSVISVVKKAQKSEQTLFMVVKKSRKRTDLFIF